MCFTEPAIFKVEQGTAAIVESTFLEMDLTLDFLANFVNLPYVSMSFRPLRPFEYIHEEIHPAARLVEVRHQACLEVEVDPQQHLGPSVTKEASIGSQTCF